MFLKDYLFSSESVSEGHPDKVCDRISDAIVDHYLRADPYARVAAETLATTNRVTIAGEVRGPESISRDDIEQLTRNCIRAIGYEQEGFHWRNAIIDNYLHQQSPDIAQGVDADDDKPEGAGDQGIMFGYACCETDALMPAPIYYAHAILRRLAEARHSGAIDGLGPDAKCQLTVAYEDSLPIGLAEIVVSTQHDPSLDQAAIRARVEPIVTAALPSHWQIPTERFHINPTGRFVIGGPDGDAGLTGRKIIVDTYGGAAPHGGGAFSGKDPTKVDRSAAYMARWLTKNIVAAGLAKKCLIQLAYGIGIARPLSFMLNSYGTGTVDDAVLARAIESCVKLSPHGIRTRLNLSRPIYERTAAYGHFGREPEADGGFSWEAVDLVETLKDAVS